MALALARAFRWRRMLDTGTHATLEDPAKAPGVHAPSARQSLRLAPQSPDIVAAILDRRQPAEMGLDDLLAAPESGRGKNTARPPQPTMMPRRVTLLLAPHKTLPDSSSAL
jgi:hypothetical protein